MHNCYINDRGFEDSNVEGDLKVSLFRILAETRSYKGLVYPMLGKVTSGYREGLEIERLKRTLAPWPVQGGSESEGMRVVFGRISDRIEVLHKEWSGVETNLLSLRLHEIEIRSSSFLMEDMDRRTKTLHETLVEGEVGCVGGGYDCGLC